MPTKQELQMLQSLPLEIKVEKTKQRIKEWVDYWGEENCYISFSGGKDSTVLLHIARELYPNLKAVFINTGLEYPEVVQFAKSFENIDIVRPKMNFREVIIKYGYPVISKEVSDTVSMAKRGCKSGIDKLNGVSANGETNPHRIGNIKYRPLVNENFNIGDECCLIMKKHTIKVYEKETHRHPIVGTMTEESMMRETSWLRTGCNSFNSKRAMSSPMSFWTEQNVLEYIKKYNIPIASVYGDIEQENNRLKCTGCQRTGCVFCMYGAHLDTQNNGEFRLNRLKITHPQLYDYVMRGGEYNEKHIWQPSQNGLGYWYIITKMNELFNKTLKSGRVKKFYDIPDSEILLYEQKYKEGTKQ